MKNGFTLLEVIVSTLIVGVLIFVGVFASVDNVMKENNAVLPYQKNDLSLDKHNVENLFELNGYDVYSVRVYGDYHVITIPASNSVYNLEKNN
jgi:prepilin-type N-terminal cleavage/methylation domain-containing protein